MFPEIIGISLRLRPGEINIATFWRVVILSLDVKVRSVHFSHPTARCRGVPSLAVPESVHAVRNFIFCVTSPWHAYHSPFFDDGWGGNPLKCLERTDLSKFLNPGRGRKGGGVTPTLIRVQLIEWAELLRLEDDVQVRTRRLFQLVMH